MSGPQTEAGRRFIMRHHWTLDPEHTSGRDCALVDELVAIEREAVAAFLASPEAAEGLAGALVLVAYPVSVPRSTWTPIGSLPGLELGPTILNPQLYATLPYKPTGKETILTRWARMGQPDGDARYTQREPHDLGDRVGWSSTQKSSLEWVNPDDGTFVLEVYHTFTAPLVFTAIIPKALNPGAFVAGRIEVAS